MPKVILPPFAALRAFVAVGRHGSIRKAAQSLGISHAIVSRHVTALEQHFGFLLLDRSTGKLTEAGVGYHTDIARAIADMEAATLSLSSRLDDRLTIWCSAGFALHWLTKRLSTFADGEFRPIVDLRSTDSQPSFELGEADGDIRYILDGHQKIDQSGLRVVTLARPAIFPVAAPAFLDQLTTPVIEASSFLALPLIEETDSKEWDAWIAAQGVTDPRRTTFARYGQAHLTLAAARAGQGIALSNIFLASEDIQAGRLRILDSANFAYRPVALGAYVFRASRNRWSDPLLAKFRTWLRLAVSADDPLAESLGRDL